MKNNKTEAGFTLIELLIGMAILGVVIAGVTTLFTQTSRLHTSQEMMVEVQQRVRAAKNLMVDEIRSAACNPENLVRMGFQVDSSDDRFNTDSNSIHFTRDIDNGDGDWRYEPDGDADDANEDIGYYRIDGAGNILNAGVNTVGTLVRNTGGGGQVVAANMVDLQFRYFDATNTEIASATMTKNSVLSKIRTVEITMVGQVQSIGRISVDHRDWTQTFRIRIRNL